MNNEIFLSILVLVILIISSSKSHASVYLNDDFGINGLCISNPWNSPNFKGDNSTAYPCHYDYAIVHVPTLQDEIKALNDQIDLLQDQIDTNTCSTTTVADLLENVVTSNKDLFSVMNLMLMFVSLFSGLSFGAKF